MAHHCDNPIPLVVAAIDFGTTYSGYAYSLRDDFNKDPLKILINQKWGNDKTTCAYKAPTSILFDRDRKFQSFGFSAESDYTDLIDNGEEEGWRFFRRFKMSLYREIKSERGGRPVRRLGRDLNLEDEQGQRMPAMDIFSAAIRHLKDQLMNALMNAFMGLNPNDVRWVLTVPAIWSDAAKQFMREAAKQAGIDGKQLTLALEPEAAAIYCKENAVKAETESGKSKDLSAFSPGEQFLLLDLGGGTVDITCHSVNRDRTLKEIESSSGGPWGGTVVDDAFFSFLKELVGRDVWKDLKENNRTEILEVENSFDMKKRDVKKDKHYMIKVGSAFIESYNKLNECDLAKQTLSESKCSSLVEVKRDKLKINGTQMLEFFQGPLNDIVQHLERLFMKPSMRRVTTILMVGGFSESDIMLKKIESSFPGKNVIRPIDASLAVLKGAVIFGHSPQAISERTSPRTYGISVSVPYIAKVHPEKTFHICDGNKMSTDVFHVMVKIGQQVVMGKTKVEYVCRPARADDKVSTVEVYESTEENPGYTFDPGCQKLGELRVSMPDISKGKERRIRITMHFGFTELKVTAREEGTNNEAEVTFDCLR